MIEEYINIRYEDMPCTIKAYTVEKDGYYTVVLNSRLCREMNVMSYVHEVSHINNDDFSSEISANQIETIRH